jgi:PspAA-like protein
VIVRIATDTQYEVPDDLVERLNAIDDDAQAAVEAGDQERLGQLLAQMAELVRTEGKPVPDDELVASDVIIPPPDATIAEIGHAFAGEGLIPD